MANCRKASHTTAMEIADWLKGLGLAQYAQAFRDNAIEREAVDLYWPGAPPLIACFEIILAETELLAG